MPKMPKMLKIPKIKETLRSISFYKIEKSAGLAHFSSFPILAHFLN
jgi:hypothetical protein